MTYDYTWVYGAAMILTAFVGILYTHHYVNRKK